MTPDQPVPLCDIQLQYKQLELEMLDGVKRVLDSGQVILGPEVEALEKEIARYCQAKHGVGCASGTDALLLAIEALGIGAGDEVILPPFTFFAIVGEVKRAGARPVFADIDPATYNIDPALVEERITARTRAIMPIHLFGQCAEMEALQQLATMHNLVLIEDAAQALGAEYHGKRAGAMGEVACYSFYPSKNLGACGEAGMIVTDNDTLAKQMSVLRNQGMDPKYVHQSLGWNARMDAIQAAILRVKFARLDEWTQQRQEAARQYDALIDEFQLAGHIQAPAVAGQRRHIFNQYVVRVTEGRRDALLAHLRANQIGCEIYYPIPMHLQACFANLGHGKGDFPASEQAAGEVLALPMFPGITATQQRRVMQTCRDFLNPRLRASA